MTIAKDIAAKFAVAFIAAAMIFTAFAPAASAQEQSVEDLQALIESLMAEISALEGGSDDSMDSMSSASSVCPYTWTRDLNQGSTGADVMKLQQFLNDNPDTQVSLSGAGAPGFETDYYGPATAAAVSKFQVMYRSEVLTPVGLVNPTGYFGPSTRSVANAKCVAAPVSGGDDMGGDDMDDDMMDDDDDMMDDDDNDGPVTLRGEGTFDVNEFDMDLEEGNVQESAEDEVVAEMTLAAEDGDILVSRINMTIADATPGTVNGETDPWDVFEEFGLWVDGDMIASFDASDEDEYRDEDAGTFRFSGLDLVIEEDEEVEVLVSVSVANSVDDVSPADAENTRDWTLSATNVRFEDADGVVDNEDVTGSVDFVIEEAGFEDGADIESDSSNPDAATLKVEDDTSDSDEYVVHIFEIEVDQDSSDLVVEDVYMAVTVSNPAGNADILGGQADVISEIMMTIDGVEVEGDYTAGPAGAPSPNDEDDVIASSSATTVHYEFEFDGDVELEADETYTVEVAMVFEGQDNDNNYANNVTIQTTAPGTVWEVEGLENDMVLTGSDTSEVHTLASVVPVVSGVTDSATQDDPNDSGTISFEFNIEADGDDDVTFAVADNAAVDGASDDIEFSISGTDATIAVAGLALVDGDATFAGGTWTINDGDDATFALDVAFTTVDAADNGTYRVTLDRVAGVEVDETSAGLTLSN